MNYNNGIAVPPTNQLKSPSMTTSISLLENSGSARKAQSFGSTTNRSLVFNQIKPILTKAGPQQKSSNKVIQRAGETINNYSQKPTSIHISSFEAKQKQKDAEKLEKLLAKLSKNDEITITRMPKRNSYSTSNSSKDDDFDWFSDSSY